MLVLKREQEVRASVQPSVAYKPFYGPFPHFYAFVYFHSADFPSQKIHHLRKLETHVFLSLTAPYFLHRVLSRQTADFYANLCFHEYN